MALEYLYDLVTGSAAALFSWLCNDVQWILTMPVCVLSSIVLYVTEFVSLLCGICVKTGRDFLVGAYSNAQSGLAGAGERLVSYAPSVWDYANLLVLYFFTFVYNIFVSVWECGTSMAMRTFIFLKWFVRYVCTDLASYAWSGMMTALEWTSSAVMAVASYGVAVAVGMYTLAVQGFWATYNGVVMGAEGVFPAVSSLISYGAQAGACMFQWGYGVCAALVDYGYMSAVQVYRMLEFTVIHIWAGAVPASLYVWNVVIASFQWAYSFSWTVALHILAAALVAFHTVAEGVSSAWSVVIDVMRHTYPVIFDWIMAGFQWVWDIRYSVHIRWIAEGLWSAVCTIGSLLLMVAAQAWSASVFLFTCLYSAVLVVLNVLLSVAQWICSFAIYNFVAIVCCIAVVLVVVVVCRKILRCAGVTSRGMVVAVVRLLEPLFESLGVQTQVRRQQPQRNPLVREWGTQLPVQGDRAGVDQEERATRQQRDFLRTVLQDVTQTSNDDRLCVICCVDEKAVMLRPCKHVCLCTECSKNIQALRGACPICRSNFTETERVYI